jgi:hypothetical protein
MEGSRLLATGRLICLPLTFNRVIELLIRG